MHQDHLGGTVLTTDSSGSQVSSLAYYPFGGTRSTSGTPGTDRRYTGQRLDMSGLYFYNARYYDAGIGRFVSADTVEPGLGNAQELNLFAYVINNPLKYNDPTGLRFVCEDDDSSCNILNATTSTDRPDATDSQPDPSLQSEPTGTDESIEDTQRNDDEGMKDAGKALAGSLMIEGGAIVTHAGAEICSMAPGVVTCLVGWTMMVTGIGFIVVGYAVATDDTDLLDALKNR